MPATNCLTATFTRVGGLSGSAERVGGLSASFGLVCTVSQGGAPAGYEVLWVQDGMLLTVDNGNLFVRKINS